MRTPIAGALCAALVAGGLAASAAAAAPTAPSAPTASGHAAQIAAAYVATHPALLNPSGDDAYTAGSVVPGGSGLQYVPYVRSYRGVPVTGGDFVVVVTPAGQIGSVSVGQQQQALTGSVTPTVTAEHAAATALALLPRGRVLTTELQVDALLNPARLAWQSLVTGMHGQTPVRLRVTVDALTGAVLSQRDEVSDGSGTAVWNGPEPVSIATSGSGTSFSMTDSTRPGISCRDFTTKAVLTGPDDLWGNGNATDRETGCVDALFSVQHEWAMLGSWLGRSGINGSGSGFPIYVGLNDVNAYWDGTGVSIGHNNANQWIGAQDVVGHEFGHAIDDTTPGGISANGVSEATGDIFGTATEFWSNEATPYDTPDFTIGEQINLVGSGPIRNMANPGTVGDPACYSSSIPNTETHAAAGPFDHWFYLASGGQAAAGASRTSACNSATVAGGLGVTDALRVFYNAMLAKTTGMTYLKYRTATLNAAKSLFPADCNRFNTVKAAWDAVAVPAQAADPVCTASGLVVNNPGSRSGTVGTAIASFTMTASGGSGSYTWSAVGLPPGVSVNSATGVVSGTPSTAGTYSPSVTATSGTSSGSTSFSFLINPAGGGCPAPGQKLVNPGFESGSTGWTGSAGVIGQYASSGEPARTGTWLAWLDGYGTTHTDTISQSVTVPAGCSSLTVSFYVHIDTAETTTSVQYDKLAVTLGTSTVASLSNLNKAAGYQLRTVSLPATAGTQTLKFLGTEDSSLQTSFVVDDVAVTVG